MLYTKKEAFRCFQAVQILVTQDHIWKVSRLILRIGCKCMRMSVCVCVCLISASAETVNWNRLMDIWSQIMIFRFKYLVGSAWVKCRSN